MIQAVFIAVFWLIFFFSLWKQKEIPVKYFLCLLIALSLCQSTLFIDYKNLSGLFYHDDYAKYFTYTSENLHQLLTSGTPFGFNHYFQGGIPSIYLTSCFLELLPFSLFFGDAMGYQLMIILFVTLVPVSLFFLSREITQTDRVARVLAMASTFQLGLWPLLQYGMIPAFVSMPLCFFSILFFLRYLAGKKYSFFPLVFFTTVLVYTHIVIWANTMLFFLIIAAVRLIGQKKLIPLLKRPALFGVFHLFAGLPLWYNLFSYRKFLNTGWVEFQNLSVINYLLSILRNFLVLVNPRNIFFLSILFLLWLYFQSGESRIKKTLLKVIIFNLILLLLLSIRNIPGMQFFFQKFDWAIVPYTVAFNLALAFLFGMKKKAAILGIIIVVLILIRFYPPRSQHLETIKNVSEIDDTISSFISPGDYALFENCAHWKKYGRCPHSHWEGYLQKGLGIKFFAHQGNDSHPFNILRSMYLLNGYFREKPLGPANKKEFISLLKDWSVNKVCVWSATAKTFFDNCSEFRFLGNSKKYSCYEATYKPQPEVRLEGGKGRITEESPFSFTVLLEECSGQQTVTVNKNYFKFWSASDERGRKIPLKSCGQKICFECENNSQVFFKYKKNVLLSLIALLVLPLSFILGFIQPKKNP